MLLPQLLHLAALTFLPCCCCHNWGVVAPTTLLLLLYTSTLTAALSLAAAFSRPAPFSNVLLTLVGRGVSLFNAYLCSQETGCYQTEGHMKLLSVRILQVILSAAVSCLFWFGSGLIRQIFFVSLFRSVIWELLYNLVMVTSVLAADFYKW